MKIFLISQDVNDGYDTYDSAVVCAQNEESAKRVDPSGYYKIDEQGNFWFKYADGRMVNEGTDAPHNWCKMEDVQVQYIGEAKEGSYEGVICSSFNAG